MKLQHHYAVSITWQGNRGSGTSDYRAYGRQHVVETAGKPQISGSSDPAFRGDRDRWNPEELLLAALSQCHMLSYLHVAATNGVVVVAYSDDAIGTMEQTTDGGGHFTSATLRPRVILSVDADQATVALAERLHTDANRVCFIASSVNFPVLHEPTVGIAAE